MSEEHLNPGLDRNMIERVALTIMLDELSEDEKIAVLKRVISASNANRTVRPMTTTALDAVHSSAQAFQLPLQLPLPLPLKSTLPPKCASRKLTVSVKSLFQKPTSMLNSA